MVRINLIQELEIYFPERKVKETHFDEGKQEFACDIALSGSLLRRMQSPNS